MAIVPFVAVRIHDSYVHGQGASLEVAFGDDGAIASVSALRHRDVRGNLVLTPWAGRFGEYARVGEMMIPHRAEVEWVTAQGPEPVWRGRIVEARYTFAPALGAAPAPA